MFNFSTASIIDFLFNAISALIISFTLLPIHEYAHAYVADRLGDTTPRYNGRLSLNPMAHIDWMGTICLMIFGFGWAKPVPVNSENFKNPKRGMGLVALAGPLSNVVVALIFVIISKLLFLVQLLPFAILAYIFATMAVISLFLGVFNLLPIPPLDGSKILGMFLTDKAYYKYSSYTNMMPRLLPFLLLFLFRFISPFLNSITYGILGGFDKITFFLGDIYAILRIM